jgi:hypothetical protein
MRKDRWRVEMAASEENLKGSSGKRVVLWDPDGRNVTAGPGIISIISIIAIKCIMQLMTIILIIIIFVLFCRRKILRISA